MVAHSYGIEAALDVHVQTVVDTVWWTVGEFFGLLGDAWVMCSKPGMMGLLSDEWWGNEKGYRLHVEESNL